jgi:hypothetical protein
MKKVVVMSVLCMFVVISILAISAKDGFCATNYNVYCANGKVEVDTRSLSEMKSARGSNTCLFRSYDYRTEAVKFANAIGGVGALCKCQS